MQMDPARELAIYKGFVMGMLKRKGLHFEKNMVLRDMGSEVKSFNADSKLNPPLTIPEFCEIYLDMVNKLMTEHVALVEKRKSEFLSRVPEVNETPAKEKKYVSSMPGPLFTGPAPVTASDVTE